MCNTILCPKLVDQLATIFREEEEEEEEGAPVCRDPICGHSAFQPSGTRVSALVSASSSSRGRTPAIFPTKWQRVASRIHALTATTRFLVSSLAGDIDGGGGDNSIFSCKSHINTLRKRDRVHARRGTRLARKADNYEQHFARRSNGFDGRNIII